MSFSQQFIIEAKDTAWDPPPCT